MSSNNIDPDDSPDLTGVVGYELVQSYETAKTLLLFGLATYAVGIHILTNFEPVGDSQPPLNSSPGFLLSSTS